MHRLGRKPLFVLSLRWYPAYICKVFNVTGQLLNKALERLKHVEFSRWAVMHFYKEKISRLFFFSLSFTFFPIIFFYSWLPTPLLSQNLTWSDSVAYGLSCSGTFAHVSSGKTTNGGTVLYSPLSLLFIVTKIVIANRFTISITS